MNFIVNFYNKKDLKKSLISINVESENDVGIVLKAKIIALTEHGFRYNKKKHDFSFVQI